MPGPNTLFCDVGGVLVDNPWTHTAHGLSARYGFRESLVFELLTDLSLDLDRGRITLKDLHARLEELLGGQLSYRYFAALALGSALRRVPPVWKGVMAVKNSKKTNVVALSNMSKETWSALRRKFGIESLFHSEVLSFEHGVLKPGEEIFRLAMAQTGSEPSASLFVDDNLRNLRAAKSLGLRTYHARSAEDTADFLRRVFIR